MESDMKQPHGQKDGELRWTSNSALDIYWLTNEEISESIFAFYAAESGHKQGNKPIVCVWILLWINHRPALHWSTIK